MRRRLLQEVFLQPSCLERAHLHEWMAGSDALRAAVLNRGWFCSPPGDSWPRLTFFIITTQWVGSRGGCHFWHLEGRTMTRAARDSGAWVLRGSGTQGTCPRWPTVMWGTVKLEASRPCPWLCAFCPLLQLECGRVCVGSAGGVGWRAACLEDGSVGVLCEMPDCVFQWGPAWPWQRPGSGAADAAEVPWAAGRCLSFPWRAWLHFEGEEWKRQQSSRPCSQN